MHTGTDSRPRGAIWSRPYMRDELLPPDLTVAWRWRRRLPTCDRGWGSNWRCTRMANHTGRHAAGDGVVIRAVW